MIEKARQYATNHHQNVNHLYDGHPYSFHLRMVYNVAINFIHLIKPSKHDVVLSSCWTHDLIEDCRVTYNDVRKNLGLEIAEITYALTNEKGKNRSERANGKYYEGIRETKFATFVKLCDRIANVEYSNETESGMYEKYRIENKTFTSELYCAEYEELFIYLRSILK